MIIELGHFALILAFILSLIQSAVPLAGATQNRQAWMMAGRASSISIFGLCSIAFLSLLHAYALSDFSVFSVFRNSHTMKPTLYKLAAAWGNHEGSMLLWVWMLSFWGFLVVAAGKKLPLGFQARVTSFQGMLLSGFLLFILFTSNPFFRIDPAPPEGMGFNPVLQDPLLALHPPLLYTGYVGFSIVFCFAMAALVEKKIDREWATFLRPWVLSAWAALTAGIALGSFWAYYELGWGGFWFWDPVENASLMPWLAGTALLHSVLVLERREALKGWTIFLAILAFSLSLLGTFLVRSGILTSVHAFASDPGRGVFILALVTLYTGSALLLFGLRAPSMKLGESFGVLSRETAVLLNNVFLFAFCATVFTGTFYPVFMEALGAGSVSVGSPYYNTVLLPVLLPLALLMGVVPFLPWGTGHAPAISKKMIAPALLLAGTVLALLLLPLPKNPAVILGFGMAGWILIATFSSVLKKTDTLKSFRTLPRNFWGMVTAHAGFAVLLAGVTAATQWDTEKILWMGEGDRVTVAGKSLTFLGIEEGLGPDYNVDSGIFTVETGGSAFAFLLPEKRWYPVDQKETTETALLVDGFNVFYLAMGEADKENATRRVVRIYNHPLLLWIYAGAFLMALGGLIAASSRRERHGHE